MLVTQNHSRSPPRGHGVGLDQPASRFTLQPDETRKLTHGHEPIGGNHVRVAPLLERVSSDIPSLVEHSSDISPLILKVDLVDKEGYHQHGKDVEGKLVSNPDTSSLTFPTSHVGPTTLHGLDYGEANSG